jgi:hypothetical protein
MAKATTEQRVRAPQGAKRVAQAFFSELETIAEDKQAEVGKAAQAMVRETMMARREKAKTAMAKTRTGAAGSARRTTSTKAARKTRGPARGPKARTRRATSSEPASADTQDTGRTAGES